MSKNPANYMTYQTFCPPPSSKPLDMVWEKETYANTTEPKVFGRAFWFTLHNGAAHYPENASPIVREHMKGFILGIPIMLPCQDCSEHARAYIELNYSNLGDICSGRNKLFKFFVDFHNYVNARYNKPIMSVEDAWKLYKGRVNVSVLKYE